ncbi:uncharacterized protein LOC121857045 isoform X2 [Homarus americanus]|uniref:uncharacterized protein LOC121857045 isoform X2 n=1 Tax=Homarus americanus TaxID=6706 RepID=UPI001C45D97D|nr:uncharacterized protein LOC121857045 isoform X2 [Homarus americanus]
MHINGGGGEERGKGEENGIDSFNPFFTPQHRTTSPAQSYFSVPNSQDSLDVYHDAYTSLQRPHINSLAMGERKRHASLGAAAREKGSGVEMSLVEDSTKMKGMLPHEPAVVADGRTRHASCSVTSAINTSRPHGINNPYHIGRLSLSTNSLKKKTDRDHPSKKMGSLQKIGESSNCNWVPNYIPHVEVKQISEVEDVKEAPAPIARDTHPKKLSSADDAAWRRNYVPCVEVDRLLGRIDEGEIQLCPGQIEQSKETVMHMYTFGPVQRRSVGLQRVRQEFKADNLYLHHKAPHLFVSSQWQQHNRMSCLYLGYRLFWALYFCMWAVWAWVGSMGYDANISMKGYFMVYMTNWGLWTLAIDTTIQAFNIVLHFKKISEDGDASYPSMTGLMKVSWTLSNITGAVHLFITSAYWITVYPNRSDEELNEIGVNTHIMPGLYILLDVAISATPRRLLHAYQPSLFIIAYTFFNLTYYLCGGLDYQGRSALYPVLDWTSPGTTIAIMSTVILGLIPFLHAILCALYAARVKVWRILKISRYIREEDETDQVEGGAQEQKV